MRHELVNLYDSYSKIHMCKCVYTKLLTFITAIAKFICVGVCLYNTVNLYDSYSKIHMCKRVYNKVNILIHLVKQNQQNERKDNYNNGNKLTFPQVVNFLFLGTFVR